MTRYRIKPTLVDARQWTGDNETEIVALLGVDRFDVSDPDDPWGDDPDATAAVRDVNKGGTWQFIYTGDWVIRFADGETTYCRADKFDSTFEPVEASA